MVEEPSSLQQQSPSQIIQRVLGVLEQEGAELAMVTIEAEEEIIVMQVADKVPQNRGLMVQALVDVESGGQEVAQVAEQGDAPRSSDASPINAQEVGGIVNPQPYK